MQPEYIFETSWEVCNRVGGIYAVLSTKAASMQAEHKDKVIFFGPDLGAQSDRFFREDRRLLRGKLTGVRIGRWQVPGTPIAVLLPFEQLRARKNDIYAWAWERFGVQSHAAYGDYDDSSLFGYAAGQVMEQLYNALGKPATVVHANEWQTAFTLFYVRAHMPEAGTVFTTHATGIGRSIAGNGKPLYDFFHGYDGDQMAAELNMVSKHSAEKQAAHCCHCFTTVSDLTARECLQLLGRKPDIVTPNGFEGSFVPQGAALTAARSKARKALISFAEQQTGRTIGADALLTAISGRLEWKNKGIDVFIDAMQQLPARLNSGDSPVVAFVMIPYLEKPAVCMQGVSIVFMPWYLPSELPSPVQDMSYFDLLPGLDLTVFPSYYEPWGYTPLESVAFHVPTVTTSLAGFGVWAEQQKQHEAVTVIHRTDRNGAEVVSRVADCVADFLHKPAAEREALRRQAAALAAKAAWKHFFRHYRDAYALALKKAAEQ